MLCCKTRSCHARRHNDLEGRSNFSSTIYSFSISVLRTSLPWRPTVAFTFFKVKSAKCLCLLPAVLVLRIWSCLHHYNRIGVGQSTAALQPAHHSHTPSHIHCFIRGSKFTFSANLFHHSLLAPTWTAFSDYTGLDLLCTMVFHF